MINNHIQDIKDNPNVFSLYFLRLIIGLMWISEGIIKFIDRHPANSLADYNSFLSQLHLMADTNPIKPLSSLINSYLIPNYILLAWIVILLEIYLGLSCFGFFSRLGSIIGMVYAIILYLSTLGWGDWPWSYFMIFMSMGVIFISGFQTRIGLDKYLFQKYKENILISWLI